jgi:heme-degrading monooxygenase HmoA
MEFSMNSEQAGFVVVDTWKVKPGKEQEIRPLLARAHHEFSMHPEILSVDYCSVDTDLSQYLVIFRYTSEDARERFVASDALTSTMKALAEYWDHHEIFVKGPAADLSH